MRDRYKKKLQIDIHRRFPDMGIYSPNGSRVLNTQLDGRPQKSTSKLECPSRPRQRHDPSLVDMSFEGPYPPLEPENDGVDLTPKRINPCCLCKVGFYHGALNLAMTVTGLNFFAMFYCLYISLFTKDYTFGFFEFWGIPFKYEKDSPETQILLNEVYVISIVGTVLETIGFMFSVILLFGIVHESAKLCNSWCIVSTILTAISIFGMAFLGSRLTFAVVVPLPFAVLIQAFGLWVIKAFVESIDDPKICPVCHQLLGVTKEKTESDLSMLTKYPSHFTHVQVIKPPLPPTHQDQTTSFSPSQEELRIGLKTSTEEPQLGTSHQQQIVRFNFESKSFVPSPH